LHGVDAFVDHELIAQREQLALTRRTLGRLQLTDALRFSPNLVDFALERLEGGIAGVFSGWLQLKLRQQRPGLSC
jgi:hypothetical protein